MSKKILYYKVKYRNKWGLGEIKEGIIGISGYVPKGLDIMFAINQPEDMAFLMNPLNEDYDFTVISGIPFYQETNKNEQIEPKIENKGIVYESVCIGLHLYDLFEFDLMNSNYFYKIKYPDTLVNAGIYFLQWHANRKNTDKAKEINRTVLYLRTLRYLKEKYNINLI